MTTRTNNSDMLPQTKRMCLKQRTSEIQLPTTNSEQRRVLDRIEEENVCVNALAGSGKTTLALQIAKHFNQHQVLLFTLMLD